MDTLVWNEFARQGGPAIWAIAALSVVALAAALWKLWHLARLGVWSHKAETVMANWSGGPAAGPLAALSRSEDALSRLTLAAIEARLSPHFSDAQAREETARIAKSILADARSGLRILDLTVTIAPLLGLLGTVLGMIAAFQALQAGGVGAEASTLAGGIWQALLTTAAGMAVAIPASVVLTWFESLIEALQNRMEDLATRVFVASIPT